jgi:hypothetical protein
MLRWLRAWPVSSWRHGERERATRAAAQELADLTAEAAGERRRVVPDVGVTALPDQLVVLAADARAAGAPEDAVRAILDRLADALGLRR